MAEDYGTDLAAIDELPDPEVLVSGDDNVAYALARRITTPPGAMRDIGDDEPYDSIDLYEALGGRLDAADLRRLEQDIAAVCRCDPRVRDIRAAVTFVAGVLTTTIEGLGTNGPFGLVLSISQVSSAVLQVS